MARTTHRLTAVKTTAIKAKGLYHDGDGLYLRVTRSGSKSWMLRYKLKGVARDMGLGPYPQLSLAAARKEADAQRDFIARKIDPIDARKVAHATKQLAAAKAVTFRECAEALIASHEASWRNEKHRQQWRNTLTSYAYPIIGHLPVSTTDTALVMKILQPLWATVPETASRLRGRMERVLDAAKARGLRAGENPCRWRGHLDALLPARSKVRRVRHHPALPYPELPAFIGRLRERKGTTPLALEFTILTAARTGEALGAKWPEVSFSSALWTVPASRMKSGREHRVPLSPRALEILEGLHRQRCSEFVFSGLKAKRPLSNMALLMLLRDIRPDVTTHGFRSTFKDWCADATSTPNFVSEAALAHVIADRVEQAYRRTDLLEKRRRLMDLWCLYCGTIPPEQVDVSSQLNRRVMESA